MYDWAFDHNNFIIMIYDYYFISHLELILSVGPTWSKYSAPESEYKLAKVSNKIEESEID